MSRNTIARYLRITVVLTVFALFTLRSKVLTQARNLGKLQRDLVAKTKCFLEARSGRN